MKGTTPCPDTATLGSDFTIQIKPFITRPAHSCQALCRALFIIPLMAPTTFKVCATYWLQHQTRLSVACDWLIRFTWDTIDQSQAEDSLVCWDSTLRKHKILCMCIVITNYYGFHLKHRMSLLEHLSLTLK